MLTLRYLRSREKSVKIDILRSLSLLNAAIMSSTHVTHPMVNVYRVLYTDSEPNKIPILMQIKMGGLKFLFLSVLGLWLLS